MFDYHISYDDGVTIAQDKGGRLPTVEEIRDAIVRARKEKMAFPLDRFYSGDSNDSNLFVPTVTMAKTEEWVSIHPDNPNSFGKT